jgi:enamine deaminase RidA (YjgF/YER057c/UK114 family)
LAEEGSVADESLDERRSTGVATVPNLAVHAPDVLNEAPTYPQPTSFSRGLRVEAPAGATHLFLSGTASIGPNGETLYPGDFGAQCWRTYRNLTRLLEAGGATWHDVVRCTCYLRDIERDYESFNDVRTELFTALGLDPLPASTAIQARLCRSDLLVEIEVHAMMDGRRGARRSEAGGEGAD